MSDLRFAFRQLLKAPAFTLVAVLSLALGIGALTTTFCWIQGILLNPLPGTHRPSEMVVLTTSRAEQMWDTCSLPDLQDHAEQKQVFAGIIASQVTPACLTLGEQSLWIYGQIATANFFDVLGVQPLHGRTFLPDEDRKPGGNPVLVLSESFWRRQFNADPAVVGRTVELNQHAFTIVGIVPAAFRGTMSGLVCDFWAPVSMCKEVANFGSLTERTDRWLHTQARLRPGVTIAQAQAVADTVSARLQQTYPDKNTQIRLNVLSFSDAPYGAQPIMGPVFTVLLVVSTGVLLIVAANLASLLLARATGRQKEIAIRLAMGAGRVRLIRQLLTESLLLAACGGALGILVAYWAVDLLAAWQPPTPLPVQFSASINGTTLLVTVLGTVATGIVFGLVPAFRASKPDLNSTLKDGGRSSSTGAEHHRLRSAFVAGQLALSLMLLIGAGLCIKSARNARQTQLGIDPNRVLLAGLRIGMNGYTEASGKIFYRQLKDRIAALPGVENVALSSWFPLGFERGPQHTVTVDGHEQKPGEDSSIPYAIVSPDYFATLKIPLLEGRDFTEQDDAAAPKAAVVNETMARRFWPGQSPIGRTFRAGGRNHTVIGMVPTGKYYSLNEAPRGFYFVPYIQGVGDLSLGVSVRTVADPAGFATTLQREIHQLDPRVEVWASLPMTDYIKAAYIAPVLASRLLIWLGVVALLLAAMGVYGVVAYVVSQRTQEFGVRMALGAKPSDVLRLVIGHGMRVAFVGMGVGLLGALAVTRLLGGFLHGISPFDPLTFAAVMAGLALVSLLACWIPARRATKVNPVDALRAE